MKMTMKLSERMEDDFKLIALHVNRLLSCYEGFQNPEQPGAELMKALDPLFKGMADLAPYCEDRFSAKYGTILDFMRVDEEDMEKSGGQIEWLPVGSATLIEKGEVITDGSQTETD